MPATASLDFSFFYYHGSYARYPQAPHLTFPDIKMIGERLEVLMEDQGTKRRRGIEPRKAVDRAMGAEEFAQAVMFHVQCLDAFYFSRKQRTLQEDARCNWRVRSLVISSSSITV